MKSCLCQMVSVVLIGVGSVTWTAAARADEPENVFELGLIDSLSIDQPRVAAGFLDPLTLDRYPTTDGSGFTMLLDTGASGYLLAMGAHQDYLGWLDGSAGALTYPIAGQYAEQGVGGFELMDITTPMDATISSYLGMSGVLDDLGLGGGSGTQPGNIATFDRPGVQALVAPNLNIGSFDGIIGMPGMNGTGVIINMSSITGASMDTGIGDSVDMFDYIHVGFTDNMPNRLASHADKPVHSFEFERFSFDHTSGQIGDDGPIPTHDDLPLLSGVGVGHGEAYTQGTYLFDTGAQLSMISGDVARSLGIDPDDASHETLLVGGVGGEVEIPIVLLDRFTLDTAMGGDGQFDRLAFDDVVVGIIDIPGLPVDGILGFNAFTTGYLNPILAALSGDPTYGDADADGAFLEMMLDFTDEQWAMHLVENENYTPTSLVVEDLDDMNALSLPFFGQDASLGTGLDNMALFGWPAFTVPEPGTMVLVAGGALVLLRRRPANGRPIA
ncbi:MAG: aspartyl protease family protein [Phycisphaeraceae bacterium]